MTGPDNSGMSHTRRALGWLVAVALVAGSLVGLVTSPAAATGPGTSSILSAVNAARAAAGRRALSLRSDLSSVAYNWSLKMAASGTLSHNPNLTSQVTNWRWVGENVGYGPDWQTVENAFMASPAHRANILDSDYTQIGIGVVASGGRVWVTQVFRTPMTTTSATTTRTFTRSTTTRRTTSRPAARAVAPAPRPRPATPPARAVPSAAQLLAGRISRAAARAATTPAGDPLVAALGFSDAMRAVGG